MFVFLLCLAMAAEKNEIPAHNEGCKVACIRSGYDGGKVADKGCVCFIYQEDYEKFIHNIFDLKDTKRLDRSRYDY